MSQKLFESYRWLVPIETGQTQGKKVIVRGKALHATVSKNLKKYVVDELQRAARTLAQKYIDVNHEYSVWAAKKAKFDAGETALSPGPKPKLKGNLYDAEYEDGYVEYHGEVNYPEYVDKMVDRERMTASEYVKKWDKNPIRYVSVDAAYRFHRETDGTLEPHGLIFNGLSLVEDPENPGVEGTSLEVMEIRETETIDPQLAILKNIFEERGIATEIKGTGKNKYLEAKELNMLGESDAERAKTLFNFTEETWGKLSPEERITYMGKLPKTVVEIEEGGEGVPSKPNRTDTGGEISVGTIPKLGAPDIPIALEKIEGKEWYGKWESFEACVAANSDKGDPEAYCASIHGKGGKETEPKKVMVEVSDRSIEELRHLKEHEDIRQSVALARDVIRGYAADLSKQGKALEAASKQDKVIGEAINGLVETVNKISSSLPSIIEQLNKSLEGLATSIQTSTDSRFAAYQKTADGKANAADIVALNEKIAALPDHGPELKAVQEKVATIPDRGPEIKALDEKISTIPDRSGDIKALQESVDKLSTQLIQIDGKLGELVEAKNWVAEIKDMWKRVMDKKAIDDSAQKKLTETSNGLEDRVNSLEQLVKQPQFKVGASNESSVAKGDQIRPVGRNENPATG